jgi:hypothetical protein
MGGGGAVRGRLDEVAIDYRDVIVLEVLISTSTILFLHFTRRILSSLG